MVFSFLKRIILLFEEYFGDINEESIRDNFVIIHELLDEIMDNGYPQITEAKILAEYIKTESHFFKEKPLYIPAAVSNAVSWRKEGIKYKKNEIFLDIIEKLNMLINENDEAIKCEV